MNDGRKNAIEFACKHLQTMFDTLTEMETNHGIGARELELLDFLEHLEKQYQDHVAQTGRHAIRGEKLRESQSRLASAKGLSPDNLPRDEGEGYPENIRRLVKISDKNMAAFDALCIHGAQCVSDDREIPFELREFVVAVLTGKQPRPSPIGRPKVNPARDALLFAVIFEVAEKFCLTPTRNDASGHEMSACDIVAEAMRELRHSPASYTALKEIWVEQKRRD